MGYSCTSAAGDALDRLAALLSPRAAGRPSNEYTGTDGRVYFWEVGEEQTDGAVTGTVMRMMGDGTCAHAGGFRIAPNGRIERFPYVAAELRLQAEARAEVLAGTP